MKKIITTKFLKSDIAFPCLGCLSIIDRSKTGRINFHHSIRVVPRSAADSFVDWGSEASNLRMGRNYLNTVARTMTLQNRSV